MMRKPTGRRKSLRDIDAIKVDLLRDLDAEALKIHRDLSKWFDQFDAADQILKPGDYAPEFLLPDAFGNLISSHSLRRSGPAVISFFRGSWSACCAAELSAMQAVSGEFRAMGANLVAISPDTGDFPREFKKDRKLDLTILSDIDYGVGLAYGVLFPVPADMKAYLLGIGVDFYERHGTFTWLLPVPATFIVDQQGAIAAVYAETDMAKRPGPGAILKQLLSMTGTAAAS